MARVLREGPVTAYVQRASIPRNRIVRGAWRRRTAITALGQPIVKFVHAGPSALAPARRRA